MRHIENKCILFEAYATAILYMVRECTSSNCYMLQIIFRMNPDSAPQRKKPLKFAVQKCSRRGLLDKKAGIPFFLKFGGEEIWEVVHFY